MAIPRGQVLLASGHAKPDDKKISVTAKRGETGYGICSTDFLEQAFRTDSYRCDITFNDDGSWTYLIQTELMVRGAAVQSSRHQYVEDGRRACPQSVGEDREGTGNR